MRIFELYTETEWKKRLEAICHETDLAMSLTDPDGKIIFSVGERNDLCLRIRQNSDTLTGFCSQTNTAMTAQVKATQEAQTEYCEGGLIRVAIPVFLDGEIVGQVTGCGLKGDPGEIDTFYLSQELDIPEEKVEKLVETVKENPEFSAEALKKTLISLLSLDTKNNASAGA